MTVRSEGEQLPHDDAPAANPEWVHNDGTPCADWHRCDTYEHHRPDGTETITKIKARPLINVDTRPELCVECHHRYFDHNSSANGGDCRITGCTCGRYYDPEPEQRDGNVGELIDGRVDVYGDPVAVFLRHAQVWSGILGVEVQPWQVALCMMGYKLVRTSVTPDYSDNSDDIDGYKDIFVTLIGDEMVQARDTKAYLAGGGKGART
jgi:hypothetical protein